MPSYYTRTRTLLRGLTGDTTHDHPASHSRDRNLDRHWLHEPCGGKHQTGEGPHQGRTQRPPAPLWRTDRNLPRPVHDPGPQAADDPPGTERLPAPAEPGKTSATTKARITELSALVAQGESIPVNNPPAPIQTEAKAKDVRFLLEALHGQITRAAQDGFLPPNEAKHWIREVRHILVLLHIEFFNNLGQHALQQNQPGQARLAFERGVQYLRKQQDPQIYAEQLQYLEKLLARANAQVMDKIAPVEGEENQLTAGLKDVEADADWKKKVIYD